MGNRFAPEGASIEPRRVTDVPRISVTTPFDATPAGVGDAALAAR